MLPDIANKNLGVAGVLSLIEEARNAEICRDIESLRRILHPVWADIEENPNFEGYDEAIKAELHRFCGVFLSFYGYARNLKNYQIRGKDLLTNAIEIFQNNLLLDKSAEAQVMLAFCYWNEGEVSECEAILDMVEIEFGKKLIHPVYLQICINRLLIYFWKKNTQAAMELIEEITAPMQFCTDVRLQANFHTQAGLFFRALKEYDKAVFHLNEAIRYAEKSNNKYYISVNFNNLAFLYKQKQDFKKSLECIDLSIEIAKQIQHDGFLPHALDTKALIYLDNNQPKKALETINDAIEYFYHGDDARGLTDALWTKVRCLLRMGRSREAFIAFGKLQIAAIERIGEIAADKFAENLEREVYVLKNLSLFEEVAEFKKSLVTKALNETNGAVNKASKLLGLKNHQALSDILNKQFPGLLEDSGFRRRARRRTQKPATDGSLAASVSALPEKAILRLVMPEKSFSFGFDFPSKHFETFYFDKFQMSKFGIDAGAVVAIVKIAEMREGMAVVVSGDSGFTVANTEHDSFADVFYITDENGFPVPLDVDDVVGEPIGYSLFSEAHKTFIEFSRLEIPKPNL